MDSPWLKSVFKTDPKREKAPTKAPVSTEKEPVIALARAFASAPVSISESVIERKVPNENELRVWLSNSITSKKSCGLILHGPMVSGKRTVLRLLCSGLGVKLVELSRTCGGDLALFLSKMENGSDERVITRTGCVKSTTV